MLLVLLVHYRGLAALDRYERQCATMRNTTSGYLPQAHTMSPVSGPHLRSCPSLTTELTIWCRRQRSATQWYPLDDCDAIEVKTRRISQLQDAMYLRSTEYQSGCILVRGRTTAIKKEKKTLWKKIIDDVAWQCTDNGSGCIGHRGKNNQGTEEKEPRDWRGTINESSQESSLQYWVDIVRKGGWWNIKNLYIQQRFFLLDPSSIIVCQ